MGRGEAMYEVPYARLRELGDKEQLLSDLRRQLADQFSTEDRIAVADAIRIEENHIRGGQALLSWGSLQESEQQRWLAVADAALRELSS